ncbi:DUF1292 domain-containing protein [Clostridium ihumii]|uniref:DUF1292 domain-containing protein n=1 Tax=Clostridium ihumii TaxID=1470356 RepID=UPI000590BDCC|nr:DUF1292 domain-containing protein [Clostridium ihumii]
MSDEKKCGCGCGCEGTEEVKHDGCGCGHDHNHEDSDCGCGCGCEDHEVLTVALEDEEGNSIICEIVDGFVFENNEYALVQNPEDDSVYLFKVVGDDEIGELVVPEDDEYNAARAYYENEVASQN